MDKIIIRCKKCTTVTTISLIFAVVLIFGLAVLPEVASFLLLTEPPSQQQQRLLTTSCARGEISPSSSTDRHDNAAESIQKTRRTFAVSVAQAFGCAVVLFPRKAFAKDSLIEADKLKLLKGYERLNYLLDNWVKETTICGQNDNPYIGEKGCDRTPIKVMEYLGYKNTDDPLFKADKTMRRLESLVPADREGEFLDALEKWVETADEASGLAYVSSWGEANPGGGKDRVELFLERAKKNVIDARDSLATVIDIIKIS